MDDGLLDVLAVNELSLLQALPKLVKLYRGRILGDPACATCAARGSASRRARRPSSRRMDRSSGGPRRSSACSGKRCA